MSSVLADGRRRSTPASPGPAIGLLLLLALTGCLPSSQRQNDRSLTESDSASVAFAVGVPVDTLAFVRDFAAPDDEAMLLPTSIAWDSSVPDSASGFIVADTQDGSLRRFSSTGAYRGRTPVGGGPSPQYPYIAGVRGDTAIVLARGSGQLQWILADGRVHHSIGLPASTSAAIATDSLIAVRVGGGMQQEVPPAVQLLDDRGGVVRSHELTGPGWRSSGFLRMWGNRMLALSGYRPVVDVVTNPLAASANVDTLALRGFDSPQLVRSAQFMRGEVNEPPLLTASAVGLGADLFVLNLRVDHLRIDVYNESGALERVLVSPKPWLPLERVPVDIVVRAEATGPIHIAILMQRQSGVFQTSSSVIRQFRWSPAEPHAIVAPVAELP